MADLSTYLVKGQPASYITDLNPEFSQSMADFLAAMPPHLRGSIMIYSGARSPEKQAELYNAAVAKYGSPEAARRWVAPPGKSRHNSGLANDLRFASDEARQWAHANAAKFGLTFPMAHEPWHIEPIGARASQDVAALNRAARQPILGADRRQAHIASQLAMQSDPAAQTPAVPVAAQPVQQSPIGNMLAGLMQGFASAPGGPRVQQDDSPQVSANAAALAEKGRQLKGAFLPNVDAIMSIGKLPTLTG